MFRAWPLLLALALRVGAQGTCRFIEDCIPQMLDDPNCYPRPVYGMETLPQPYDDQYPEVCPQYAASSCCTGHQRLLLKQNFQLIMSTFGEPGGGCLACYQNLVNMWCQFTCSPDQSWTPYGQITVVGDPENAPTLATVLQTSPLVDRSYACSLFQSCKDTAYVGQFPPIASCAGFFSYQGSTEGVGHGTNIEWRYTSADTPPGSSTMTYPVLPCNNFRLPGTLANISCPCSVCDASCAVEIESSAVLEGFDATAVGLMYGGVFLLTLLAMHCQQVRASMQKGQGYAALGGHTHSNINTAAAERVGAGLPVVTLNADPST